MATANQNIYSDESIFTYGKTHKGKKFKDIPASYFLWIDRERAFRFDLSLHAWITDNYDALVLQDKEDKKNQAWESIEKAKERANGRGRLM